MDDLFRAVQGFLRHATTYEFNGDRNIQLDGFRVWRVSGERDLSTPTLDSLYILRQIAEDYEKRLADDGR